eukprot:c45753_g1_i1 orf=163-339(+)
MANMYCVIQISPCQVFHRQETIGEETEYNMLTLQSNQLSGRELIQQSENIQIRMTRKG